MATRHATRSGPLPLTSGRPVGRAILEWPLTAWRSLREHGSLPGAQECWTRHRANLLADAQEAVTPAGGRTSGASGTACANGHGSARGHRPNAGDHGTRGGSGHGGGGDDAHDHDGGDGHDGDDGDRDDGDGRAQRRQPALPAQALRRRLRPSLRDEPGSARRSWMYSLSKTGGLPARFDKIRLSRGARHGLLRVGRINRGVGSHARATILREEEARRADGLRIEASPLSWLIRDKPNVGQVCWRRVGRVLFRLAVTASR